MIAGFVVVIRERLFIVIGRYENLFLLVFFLVIEAMPKLIVFEIMIV